MGQVLCGANQEESFSASCFRRTDLEVEKHGKIFFVSSWRIYDARAPSPERVPGARRRLFLSLLS